MTDTYTAAKLESKFTEAARKVVPAVLIQKMRTFVNSHLVGCIDLGFPPESLTIGKELFGAASRSAERTARLIEGELSEAKLIEAEQSFRTEIEGSFADGTWRKKLPGRDILKQLTAIVGSPVGYEVLRNLIVSRMVQEGYQPEGMKMVIDQISSA